jgi:hypothetical protein
MDTLNFNWNILLDCRQASSQSLRDQVNWSRDLNGVNRKGKRISRFSLRNLDSFKRQMLALPKDYELSANSE